jgi:hypothetical protein
MHDILAKTEGVVFTRPTKYMVVYTLSREVMKEIYTTDKEVYVPPKERSID